MHAALNLRMLRALYIHVFLRVNAHLVMICQAWKSRDPLGYAAEEKLPAETVETKDIA